MSTQMDGDDAHAPSAADYESKRTRYRRLFSCRSRKGELENPTLLESLPLAEAPPPLYFILSEVGSEEMNLPSPSMDNRRDDKASKSRPRCLRIPGFKHCFKDELHNDEETASLGKENTTLEEGDSRALPSDTSSFEISTSSAFSPVMPNKYAYPVQARRDEHLFAEQRLSMGGLEKRDGLFFSASEEDVSSFTDSSFTDSSYFKGAQLILKAFSEDSEGSDYILGVTFPRPATAGESCKVKGDSVCRLGIESGHPFWKKRERNNVWGHIDVAPIDEAIPLPPSPIVVETSINDEDDWDEDNDDEDWDIDATVFQDTNDDGFESPLRFTTKAEIGNSSCRSIHVLNDPEERKSDQAKKPTSLPDRLTKNVLEPMCEFAREISNCGRVNDAGFFDDAPFDEIALDRERKTAVGRRVKTFAQQPWDSIAITKPLEDESDVVSVEWVKEPTNNYGSMHSQFPRRNEAHGSMFLI
jgi:hypothetical protein